MTRLGKYMVVLAMAAALVAGGASLALATQYVFVLQQTLDVPGYDETYAYGLNDTGQIVGTCSTESSQRGFVYDIASDTYTTFLKPGASYTSAYGINNRGQIVGSFYDGNSHCYLYNGLGYTTFDLPGVGATDGQCVAGINGSGHMVGYLDNFGLYQGFLYTSGFKNLERIDGPAIPYDINDSGHMVGDDGFKRRGFFFDGLSYQIINHPNSFNQTSPRGLNNNDFMVGSYYDNGYHSFLYDQTTFSSINITGADYVIPWDINNEREIVGYYADSFGDILGFYGKAIPIFLPGATHAPVPPSLLLTPVPPSLLLLATGLLGLAGLGYRRRGR